MSHIFNETHIWSLPANMLRTKLSNVMCRKKSIIHIVFFKIQTVLRNNLKRAIQELQKSEMNLMYIKKKTVIGKLGNSHNSQVRNESFTLDQIVSANCK